VGREHHLVVTKISKPDILKPADTILIGFICLQTAQGLKLSLATQRLRK